MADRHVTWGRGISGASGAARCRSGVSWVYRVTAPREHPGGPMPLAVWIVAVVAVSFALAYLNSSGWLWIAAGALALLAGLGAGTLAMDVFLVLSAIFAFVCVVLGVSPLRRLLVSPPLSAW